MTRIGSSVALLGLLLALAGCRGAPDVRPVTAPVRSATSVPSGTGGTGGMEPAPLRILQRWYVGRSRAYARADPAALRRLYVGGGGLGDVRVLERYAARGLRVVGMRMQLLGVRIVAARPGLWRLRVVDRLRHAVAVGPRGRTLLPRDAATVHLITLRRVGSRWKVASVADLSER